MFCFRFGLIWPASLVDQMNCLTHSHSTTVYFSIWFGERRKKKSSTTIGYQCVPHYHSMITYSLTIPSRRQMLRIYTDSISEFWFFFFRFNCYFSTSDQNTSVTLNVWRSSNSSASGNVKNHVGMCWCVCCNCSNLVSFLLFFYRSTPGWFVKCVVDASHTTIWTKIYDKTTKVIRKKWLIGTHTHNCNVCRVSPYASNRMLKSLLFMANTNHINEQCATNCNRNGIFEKIKKIIDEMKLRTERRDGWY